uniref:Uncharacterized protein n=1 Tax=Arundo donax TaxID=35708 RepID=A0A0A8YM25_ARUDO
MWRKHLTIKSHCLSSIFIL